MQERTATSVDDVMKIAREARKLWKLPANKELWFRGEDKKHRDSTLLPKLYRHLPSSVGKVSKQLLREERNLHEEFQRCGAQLYQHDNVDDWDWYFLMQHHNAPTRLLDWSDGALMAVYFAVKNSLDATEGGFIYVLNPWDLMSHLKALPSWKEIKKHWKAYRQDRIKRGSDCSEEWDEVYLPGYHFLKEARNWDPSKADIPELPLEPLVLEFPQITRRVAAQRSRFMVYGSDRNWLTQWVK
jgi:FRG domain